MFPIFVIKFSGVSDLQGVKFPDFPLTLLVIVTTVLRYRAACDSSFSAHSGVQQLNNDKIIYKSYNINNTRSQAVARLAYHTASQQTIEEIVAKSCVGDIGL